MAYTVTVGLEVHAELSTRTKMFCACKNDPDERAPNVHICPVCMAHPGTLPVINKEAVKKVRMVGAALGGTLAERSVFDRKNYFYPDIPKGFQISQYPYPLVMGGVLGGVAITRVHLEEDTARLVHTAAADTSSHAEDKSLVDFNRAGVPLMELVTEPVIHSAAEAGRFARELQLLLRTLGVSAANMEKGEMRVEANISIAREGEALGTKVEVKNLNSFRSVERAIAFEIVRQEALLAGGKPVAQETRGWDEEKQSTVSQRKKEKAHDYRYVPEPDLPALQFADVPEFSPEAIEKLLPELPWHKRTRYAELGIPAAQAEVLVSDRALGELFEETIAADTSLARAAANYIATDIAGLVSKYGDERLASITAAGLSDVLARLAAGTLSSRGAKDAITASFEQNIDLARISKTYVQQSDTALLAQTARAVIEAHPTVADEYRQGKEAALQFLVGQSMKATQGAANPALMREELIKLLRV